MPFLSIIVPVYNVEKYLRDCLDSILEQSYNDYEVICINDGSTDSSAEILDEYCKKDNRIKAFYQENKGLSEARNAGIAKATGTYLCFLDSDDLFNRDMLSPVMQDVEKDCLDAYCYDVTTKYDSNELKIKDNKDSYYIKKNSYNSVKTGKELFSEMIMQDDYCDSAWLLIVKKIFLADNKISFYPGIYYEDVLFSLKTYMFAERIKHINIDLYVYRIRNNSIMTSKPTYKNIWSCLVNYKEVLSILMSEEDEKVQAAIIKYMRRILDGIRHFDNAVEGNLWNKYAKMAPMDQLLVETMGIMDSTPKIDKEMYLNGFTNMVRDAEEVILYGAGKIGRAVFQYLEQVGLKEKVFCFAVTHIEKEDKVCDIPIYAIEELQDKKDELVIITASAANQKEMFVKIVNMGYKNIKKIDYVLEEAIKDKLDIKE